MIFNLNRFSEYGDNLLQTNEPIGPDIIKTGDNENHARDPAGIKLDPCQSAEPMAQRCHAEGYRHGKRQNRQTGTDPINERQDRSRLLIKHQVDGTSEENVRRLKFNY